MEKSLKRLIAVILAAALCLSVFIGCGKEPEPVEPAPVPSETDVEPEPEPPHPEACENHDFGDWTVDRFSSDTILRRCNVCGVSEYKSGWVETAEVPAFAASADIIKLANEMPEATFDNLPEWNGVSIHSVGSMENLPRVDGFATEESTVKKMADYGFNYSRVILDMRSFFKDETMQEANLRAFIALDETIQMCIENGIHCSLNSHYDFGRHYYNPWEDTTFKNKAMQEAFVNFWTFMAERYKDLPSNAVDFDLMNEPRNYGSQKKYVDLMNKTIDAIREITPDRLIVVEMADWSYTAIPDFAGKEIVEAFHYYIPGSGENSDESWDVDSVRANIAKYADFSEKYGIKVILNECGAHFSSPAADVAGWFDATFAACKEYGISWNLHDYFGYYGFATADEYCIRNDTIYARMMDEGRLTYVYPDLLEAVQKNMDQSRITTSAEDLREFIFDDPKFYRAAPNFMLKAADGDIYQAEAENYVVGKGLWEHENKYVCRVYDIPEDAEITTLIFCPELISYSYESSGINRMSGVIASIHIVTDDGRVININDISGPFDCANGERFGIDLAPYKDEIGEIDWNNSKLNVALSFDDPEAE